MSGSEVQSLLLRVLRAGGDTRLGRGRHYFSEAVIRAAQPTDRPTPSQVMEAVWSLVGQGLAFIDLLAASRGELEPPPYRCGPSSGGRYGCEPG